MKVVKTPIWIETENYLRANNIKYRLNVHPPVYTVSAAEKYESHFGGLGCKSLFLRSEDKKRFFLFTLPGKERADLKKFAKIVGVKRVSFGNELELWEMLKVKPGSISPLSIINDKNNKVEFFVDKKVYDADTVLVHPNDNHGTLIIKKKMFHHFLKTL